MQKLCILVLVMFTLQACKSEQISTATNPAPDIEVNATTQANDPANLSHPLPTIDRNIIKSPNDQRDYGAIVLDNQLQVLLISDPSTDKSAAAMDVYVGSANDPDGFEGLTHFLEHMLFLGTKKYPNADEYQKFISEHGGQHNAFTSLDHTNYFFDINVEHLEGALDRFAEQFTSPLFNEEYVSREVNAVHSEFSSKLKDDGRRFFSAVKTILHKDHPYRNFAVGNLDTLKDKEEISLRDALLKFYQQHYSANTMRLVVLGKEPLEQLATWASSKFSKIKNHQRTPPEIQTELFDEGFLPAQLNVQSIMDKRSMGVAFPIPSPSEYKSSKPVSYLANLIGHEGKGSLLSALKAEQLVDSLSAGAQFDTRHDAVLMINMSLTEKGLEQQQRILEMLFAYIELIKQDGLKELYFDEQAQMSRISFAYQEKSDPLHLTRALAGALQETTAERVLFEDYDLNLYDPELYLGFANHLRPENMLVTISSQSVNGDQLSPWYQTPFSVTTIAKNRIEALQNPQEVTNLALPKKNEFIPEDVTLINDSAPRKHPFKLVDKAGIELWHQTDTEFGTPKSNLFVTIRSPIAMRSAANLNQTEIMVALLKDMLNEFSYPAYLAGLNYELYNHMRGVTIKISGYHDKQSILLGKILAALKDSPFTEERFAIIKERLKRSLENKKDRKPYEQSIAKAQRQLLEPSWSPEQRLSALESTSLKTLEAFRLAFFSALDTAVLSTGNVTETMSQNIAKLIDQKLLNTADKQQVERSAVLRLAGDATWINDISVNHPDTGFVLYLQGKDKSHSEQARFLLLSQILSSDYYAKIRTEMQLGYIVFASSFNLIEVPGLAFVVQSPNTSGPELLQETRTFLAQQTAALTNLDDATFERYKASVISRLSEQERTLYERSNRYWQEIDRNNANFDTRQQLIAQVEGTDKATFMAFYQDLVADTGRSLVVYTQTKQENDVGVDLSADTNSADSNSASTPTTPTLKELTLKERKSLAYFPHQH